MQWQIQTKTLQTITAITSPSLQAICKSMKCQTLYIFTEIIAEYWNRYTCVYTHIREHTLDNQRKLYARQYWFSWPFWNLPRPCFKMAKLMKDWNVFITARQISHTVHISNKPKWVFLILYQGQKHAIIPNTCSLSIYRIICPFFLISFWLKVALINFFKNPIYMDIQREMYNV